MVVNSLQQVTASVPAAAVVPTPAPEPKAPAASDRLSLGKAAKSIAAGVGAGLLTTGVLTGLAAKAAKTTASGVGAIALAAGGVAGSLTVGPVAAWIGAKSDSLKDGVLKGTLAGAGLGGVAFSTFAARSGDVRNIVLSGAAGAVLGAVIGAASSAAGYGVAK